jgi:VWFA-related protein
VKSLCRPRPAARVAVLLAALLSSRVATSMVPQTPTFSSRVETVRVDVSVRRGGQAVRGLSADDFEVYDKGVRQRVTFVGREDTPVNVVLALDMSDSLGDEGLAQLRAAASRLLAAFKPGDTAALVTFTEIVDLRSGFTPDTSVVLAGLREGMTGSHTSLMDAAHAAMAIGDSATGRPLVILFSDGSDTASALASSSVLETARRTGAMLYAVAPPESASGGFLDEIVRLTGGRRLDVTSLNGLSEAFERILAEARERYMLGYTPTGVPAGGYHELTVRVRGADVRARPGYLAR